MQTLPCMCTWNGEDLRTFIQKNIKIRFGKFAAPAKFDVIYPSHKNHISPVILESLLVA